MESLSPTTEKESIYDPDNLDLYPENWNPFFWAVDVNKSLWNGNFSFFTSLYKHFLNSPFLTL